MSRTPRAASPHDFRRQAPGDSFTARARGLLAAEFLLLHSNGREFGWLRMRGASGAELHLRECVAKFERSERGYRMVADGEEVLVAAPRGRLAGELEISCGDHSYVGAGGPTAQPRGRLISRERREGGTPLGGSVGPGL